MALLQGATDAERLLGDILACLQALCFEGEAAKIVDTGGGTTYTGYAKAGSAESAAVWRISKTVVAGGVTTTTWAESAVNANDMLVFNKTWSGRAGYTYL